MSTKHEIKSEKIHVKDIFTNLWFRIPEYQRPYVWGNDEIDDLLDDLTFAHLNKPEQDYFLGSFVYQSKKAGSAAGLKYDENDLLDGQQRMTTLFMLFACIRDLANDSDLKEVCQPSIYQKGNKFDGIPERTRITFAIRQEVQDFVDTFIKDDGGTNKEETLQHLIQTANDRSVVNMARAVLKIRAVLSQMASDTEIDFDLSNFYGFIRRNVLLIYVATEDLDDAFRLFTILNDRGVPLRNSDILKSTNLGALTDEDEKVRYAKLWEETEGELGSDFDRFLNHIRTILLKDKARLNLLDEFEHKIYKPVEKDKSTGKIKPALLAKGKETFELVARYLKHYNQLLGGNNYDSTGSNFKFDNLIKVMLTGLPSTDWLPPLLRYYDRFRYTRLLEFLTNLDNQLSSDWIAQYSPTKRIERMNDIIRAIEAASTADDIFGDKTPFSFDQDGFSRSVNAAVYGRRFTRYLLLKLDYLYADHSQRMSLEYLSVEHVLPQKPKEESQWRVDFTDEQRDEWTHRLGNLVLITTRKNTAQGNNDFEVKKKKYFEKRISTCPNSLRVLKNDKWTPVELQANHDTVIGKLESHYGF
ncbi:TPA: DUF262 domain-containing protein [Vibrio parahaemolyticus]|nr:DUF262 domain-containing protein [Vibrio parahaemolyticus]HCH5494714.1 DUF262 domain-containing protein [Vibrio parahaemolyticus]HCH6275979.1 DUF262 domain-containing protein [Vibrio parahaemolyticus]HCH6312396.1 DUF262 domain-containing protein [Vibrio parahaemolyticus]HCH6482982.1 DUF262 domain-containing protein [Vibrio parahaemolyticus]